MENIFNLNYYIDDIKFGKNKKIKVSDVIKKAKDYYIEGEGMCIAFLCAAQYFGINTQNQKKWIIKNIPLFNYFIAEKFFNAEYQNNGFWWDAKDDKTRLKYFDWLIEQYSKKD